MAFDVTMLSETDPTFAKQDVSIEVTPDTITSDDIIRIAAKLNKGIELAENEADLYRNEKVKDLVEKQREKLKDIDLSIKDDKPDVIEQELLDESINWKNIISKAVNERELDAIMDQMDEAQVTTPELIDEVAKKREKLKYQAQESQSLEQQKAKIERRRQEELKNNGLSTLKGESVNDVIGKISDGENVTDAVKKTGEVLKKHLPQRIGNFVLSSDGTFSNDGNWRIAYEQESEERTNIHTGEKFTDINSQYIPLDREILLSGNEKAIKEHIDEVVEKAGINNSKKDKANKINAKYDAELKVLESQFLEQQKAEIERRRQELESSREIETLYDLRKPIAEDSKEIISKIEEANKLIKAAQEKSEQAAKETNEEKIIALNSEADRLNEKAKILDKEVKKSRDIVIENTPIKQAINSTWSIGQKLLNKIKLAAKSNEWVSSMPISKEEFAKLEDAIKRLAVKKMGENTSNSEVIPDILLIEQINAKYDAELKVLESSEIQEKEEVKTETLLDKRTFLNENNGKVVIINGKQGTLTIINENRVEIENENTIYEFTIDEITSYVKPENISLNSKYIITDISETNVTVNNVEYLINTDNKGNIISLSPKNKPNSKIKNVRLIVAVEIERNKLEVKNQTILENVTVSESLIENNYGNLDLLLNTIYNINYTDIIDNALEKLYDNKELEDNEKLQLALWLQDAFDRLSKLFTSKNTELENEILLNAYDNLEIILSLLYNKNLKETTKNYKNEKKNNVGKTEVTNTSKKNKRRINDKIQEKETPLNADLFPVQSIEELNITYARKKAEQIIEELPKELLSSIENIEDAKLYLQNIILERLVKYTGKDISNITDKRSTKAIDRIVSEIKQEFFDLMEQERTVVDIETVPDSNITNVNVLSIEGIIEQVQQNTAILVESTEKILANSKKSSTFVATEEAILNVLNEIKNFKC